MKRRIIYILASFVFLVSAISVAFSFYSIFNSVKEISEFAKNEIKSDTVDSLIILANSEKFSYKRRNHAIWALGQIGDKRALETLNDLYKSQTLTNVRNPNIGLVKYSIDKSINQINSKIIVTRWMYKFL